MPAINRTMISYPNIMVLAEGSKCHGDSRTEWILFNRMSDADAKNAIDGFNMHPYYDGFGYGRKAVVRHSASYTLITQFCGLDI